MSKPAPQRVLRIGSRGSDLARWQATYVSTHLAVPSEIIIIKTSGDQIQDVSLDKVEGKGFFTKEIERALHDQRVDVAVHSLKDLPTDDAPGLHVAAIPERGPVRDVVVLRRAEAQSDAVWQLRQGARVGTSSLRRKAQIASIRPDLELVDLRGNVPTRWGKVVSGQLDAVVLAEAGVSRLGLSQRAEADGVRVVPIDPAQVCPAPAQGALGIQIRAGDTWSAEQVATLHDPATARAAGVERALLARFGGGCHLPLGTHCRIDSAGVHLTAVVAAPDGHERIVAESTDAEDDATVVETVYRELQQQGAERYL